MLEGFRKYRSLAGGLTGLAILIAMLFINLNLPAVAPPPSRAVQGAPAVTSSTAPGPVVGASAGATVVKAATPPPAEQDARSRLEAAVRDTAFAWGKNALLIVAFMMLIGVALNSRPAGLIIDNRNRVSLSKFQAAAWTVLVISALVTMAAARLRANTVLPPGDLLVPLDIHIQGELLAAMGIAATSFVATPLLLSLKTDGPDASTASLDAAAEKTGRDPASITSSGSVVGWTDPNCARWMDMFRGEEASNAGSPDLSKVQQFLITLLLIGIYAGAIWDMFMQRAYLLTRAEMPLLDSQFLWLMAISHAGYLAYKAAPHGKTETTGLDGRTIDSDGAVG